MQKHLASIQNDEKQGNARCGVTSLVLCYAIAGVKFADEALAKKLANGSGHLW